MGKWTECGLTASSYAARRLGARASHHSRASQRQAKLPAFPPASRVSISELLGSIMDSVQWRLAHSASCIASHQNPKGSEEDDEQE